MSSARSNELDMLPFIENNSSLSRAGKINTKFLKHQAASRFNNIRSQTRPITKRPSPEKSNGSSESKSVDSDDLTTHRYTKDPSYIVAMRDFKMIQGKMNKDPSNLTEEELAKVTKYFHHKDKIMKLAGKKPKPRKVAEFHEYIITD